MESQKSQKKGVCLGNPVFRFCLVCARFPSSDRESTIVIDVVFVCQVVRGPAPLSLALSHVEEDDSGKVIFKEW